MLRKAIEEEEEEELKGEILKKVACQETQYSLIFSAGLDHEILHGEEDNEDEMGRSSPSVLRNFNPGRDRTGF